MIAALLCGLGAGFVLGAIPALVDGFRRGRAHGWTEGYERGRADERDDQRSVRQRLRDRRRAAAGGELMTDALLVLAGTLLGCARADALEAWWRARERGR